jgi:hypothetical protein
MKMTRDKDDGEAIMREKGKKNIKKIRKIV